jgi:hypothetical protein
VTPAEPAAPVAPAVAPSEPIAPAGPTVEAAPAGPGVEGVPANAPHPAAPSAEDNVRLGELSTLGASKLTAHDTRFGLRAGVAKIGGVYYLAGSAEFDIAIKRFSLGLGVPVNIPIYDPSKGLKLFPQGAGLRQQDYAGINNYVKFLRYLTYGVKESDLYLNFSTQSTATIGHGDAVRRYVANIDIDHTKLTGELDLKFKYGGLESFVGDVLHPDRLVAGLLYLKPFGGFENLMLQRLSIGLSYAGDLSAPLQLLRDGGQTPVLTASDSAEPLVPRVADSRQLHIVGLSIETKILKTADADIKPYVYANQMIVTGGGAATQKLGAGGALGFLGRFGIGAHGRHAFRLVVEGRTFENNYEPGYFDTFYAIQRYQYFGSNDNPTFSNTKLADLMSRPSNVPLRVGYYAEAQYAYSDLFAVMVAYEDSTAEGGQNLVLHLEVPTFEYLRFFGDVYYRGLNNSSSVEPSGAFGPELKATNTIYFVGARVKLLPILFLNLRAFQSWQMDQNNTNNSYRNVTGFQADLELGYEFSRGSVIQK